MTTGFSEDFDLEVESSAITSTNTRPMMKRQSMLPSIGQVISVGKSGVLELRVPGKLGKEVIRRPTSIDLVILDSDFGRQQWNDTTVAGTKAQRLCGTVSHTVRTAEVEKVVEGGLWKLPFGDRIINDRYNPTGQKTDGTLMSCVKCWEEGLNTNCRQRGYIYALVIAIMNEDEEMVNLQNPMLVSMSAAMASAISYQIYATQKLRPAKLKPNSVITRLGVVQTDNKLAYRLTFDMEDEYPSDQLEMANKLYAAARAEAVEAEVKRIEEFKASRAAESGGKSWNKPDRVAKADKIHAVGDDDFDF